MSASFAARPVRRRRGVPVPLLLFTVSTLLYVTVALTTQAPEQLGIGGVVGLLQRMVALGQVALGQTVVILGGSIDLSVGTVISVAAVAASAIMRGSPGMIGPAVLTASSHWSAGGSCSGRGLARISTPSAAMRRGLASRASGPTAWCCRRMRSAA